MSLIIKRVIYVFSSLLRITPLNVKWALDRKGVKSANFLYLLSLRKSMSCLNIIDCNSHMTIRLSVRALSSACNEMSEDLQ